MPDVYTLTPYRPGMGPAFRLEADAAGWTLDMVPASPLLVPGAAVRLAEGTEYPSRGGQVMAWDEPQTIGELLHFVLAAHPDSGSGIAGDNCWSDYGWADAEALEVAYRHLDALELEAEALENGDRGPDPAPGATAFRDLAPDVQAMISNAASLAQSFAEHWADDEGVDAEEAAERAARIAELDRPPPGCGRAARERRQAAAPDPGARLCPDPRGEHAAPGAPP